MTIKEKTPVLKGFIERTGERLPGNTEETVLIHAWCPFCERFHTHGWPYEDDWSLLRYGTHRVAHCINQESPFKKGGYMIKKFTKKERKQMLNWLLKEENDNEMLQ